jgi:hypothetical protein
MTLKRIIIDFIAREDMRWHGLGDYYPEENGVKKIFVADTGNELYNRFIAIHELVEDTELIAKGIPIKVIDDYCDKVFAAGGSPTSADKDSPIHREHCFADCIEYLTVLECGISRRDYDNGIDAILDNKNT